MFTMTPLCVHVCVFGVCMQPQYTFAIIHKRISIYESSPDRYFQVGNTRMAYFPNVAHAITRLTRLTF